MCVLIHVDDVMFTGHEKPVEGFIIGKLKRFDVEVAMVKNYNDEFSFLKRKYTYGPTCAWAICHKDDQDLRGEVWHSEEAEVASYHRYLGC